MSQILPPVSNEAASYAQLPLSQAFLAGSPLPLAGAASRTVARPARASGGLSLRASMGEGIILAAVAAVDKTGTVVAEKLSPEAQAMAEMAAKSSAPAAAAAGAAGKAAAGKAAAATAGAASIATMGAGAGELGWQRPEIELQRCLVIVRENGQGLLLCLCA